MKPKKIDGVEVWKDFEDLAARLGLNVIERAVYSHLLRHTRLEGKLRLHFSLPELARKVRISRGPVRDALHRLAGHGALRLEDLDFLRSRKLRQAIHGREGGKCFYCLRRIPGWSRCLDHVVPRARSGQNSYRNVVSCCAACNWQKKDHSAEDFFRELYREGRLSRKDLSGGLRKLQALAAGKLRPKLSSAEDAASDPGKGSRVAVENSLAAPPRARVPLPPTHV